MNTNPYRCPACRQSWISQDGKWHICLDCPYRSTSFIDEDVPIIASISISDEGEVSGTFDLKSLLEYVHNLKHQNEKLIRELADLNFK